MLGQEWKIRGIIKDRMTVIPTDYREHKLRGWISFSTPSGVEVTRMFEVEGVLAEQIVGIDITKPVTLIGEHHFTRADYGRGGCKLVVRKIVTEV